MHYFSIANLRGRALYGNLKKGKSAAEALTLARREMIQQSVDPYYWAPFILIGK